MKMDGGPSLNRDSTVLFVLHAKSSHVHSSKINLYTVFSTIQDRSACLDAIRRAKILAILTKLGKGRTLALRSWIIPEIILFFSDHQYIHVIIQNGGNVQEYKGFPSRPVPRVLLDGSFANSRYLWNGQRQWVSDETKKLHVFFSVNDVTFLAALFSYFAKLNLSNEKKEGCTQTS